MSMKKVIFTSAAIIAMSLPLVAQAGSTLRIVNNTNQYSTVQLTIAGTTTKVCSTQILGTTKGVTPPHGYLDLSSGELASACKNQTTACPAEVFMTNNCSGKKMGDVIINVDKGITSYSLTQSGIDSGYSINLVNPFYVEINGGN